MRKVNTAKRLMLEGKPAFGFGLGLGSPIAAEILSHSGADFLLLDTQHGSFGPDSTIQTLMAMAAGTATPMARVARNDYTLIGRLLDEGALGIIVPMVHTAEDAKAAADACRFPPVGTRSYGWGRASAYGSDYAQAVNDEIFCAVQIESAQAVENAEAILATPGVDGCWIGPSDLALSMGLRPGDPAAADQIAAAVEKVLTACRNTGKIPGYAGSSPEQGRRLAAQGFRFITFSSDVGLILKGAANALAEVRGEG
ncbi:MAG TPA: aldolase/citrate lyase family protein [Thermomicrobiales bacterium]